MTVLKDMGTQRATALSPATDSGDGGLASGSAAQRLPLVTNSASGRAWRLRPVDERLALAIRQRFELPAALARAIASRGIGLDEVEDFLSPSLRRSMPDPFVLKDMEEAAARIAAEILAGRKIGIFGDYDVDGTTAAAILTRFFRSIDVASEIYLPDRILEGYGPSAEAFLDLQARGVDLILTVDCGAAAHDPIERAAAAGIDIVVFDHHQMDRPPPVGASAVVNPNRPDDLSGLGNLSAAGVAFMAAVAINRTLREKRYFEGRREPDLKSLLDLTALGLVCDVMPLSGLTRVLVAAGLKVLDGGTNEGLKALGQQCGVKSPASAYDLGFLLGPRINAAGRIGHARLAFELMTTDDPVRREELAERLHVLNAERQHVEAGVQEDAIQFVERGQMQSAPVIVAAGEGWHPGVIGIVAGRLKEKYDRPVVVIGLDGDTGKGSGRSISGVDLGAAINAARAEGLLISGGGHAMAAGLSIERGKLDAFSQYLQAALAGDVARALEGRVLEIDGIVAPSAVNRQFADQLSAAGPFGMGNPEPVFALEDVRAVSSRIVGKGHVSFEVESRSGERARAIAFRAEGEPLGDLIASGERLVVAGKIRADDWRGGNAAQLQIVDVAPQPKNEP